MPARYDPSRHTKEFQDMMNSDEVVGEHKQLIKTISAWKKRYRKKWQEEEAAALERADD